MCCTLLRLGALAILTAIASREAFAQGTVAVPYSAQLRSDPAVGNIQGIQRYGRPLRSDPDQGEGYSYHVYPVASAPVASLSDAAPQRRAATYRAEEKPYERPEEPSAPATGVRPATVAPFDATMGLRRATAAPPPPTFGPRAAFPQTKSGEAATAPQEPQEIRHEPLIQIKVRVVEVRRADTFAAASVLDYINRNPKSAPASYISDNTVNGGKQNLTGATRFGAPLAIANNAIASDGSGLLINLTTKHINYIASLLATEFGGDIVTAPEVVVLNGQNVEFISGAKVPFELGQNVIQGTNNNIQQFFYKHVGAYISVTPQIIPGGSGVTATGVPWENDCTIDLTIVVRLSSAGSTALQIPKRDSDGFENRNVTTEDNVRAVSNIVQVRNGHGMVMAGLIGESDETTVAKVPLLGDIPGVGFLFRSKSTGRAKNETLIFVEAKVLEDDPAFARAESYGDFRLSQRYAQGEFLDNPLEYGMCRAGFGSYLPPHSHDERVFWERFGRKIRKACTEVDDALR